MGLEKSDKAGNALACLHDEDYRRQFVKQLRSDGLLFTGGRSSQQIHDGWRFVIDPFETGLRQKWYSLESSPEKQNRDPWDYDPFVGEELSLPLSWNLLQPEFFHYEGSSWFTNQIELAPSDSKRIFLRVGASNYETFVFLNGEFLGVHLGGSTPFMVELGDAQLGANRLQFMVNNARSSNRVPMQNIDWFNYGGIHREVEIFETPRDFVKDFFTYLVPESDGHLVGFEVEVAGNAEEFVTVEIPELNFSIQIPIKDGIARVESYLDDLKLWSPEDPKLYDVKVFYGRDQVSDQVGYRDIQVQEERITLNGRPVFLKGICAHEDDEALGRVTSEEDIRKRFLHAKELGCNFMRLAHYPHHELAAKIADEVGMLLWEEVPVYWSINFASRETYDDCSNQLRELVKRDRNRASVIIWSVGNENADTDERLAFMSDLVEETRKLDFTRLVSAACLINHSDHCIEDRLISKLDVVGVNEYFGWYEEPIEELQAIFSNSRIRKPIVITETGAGAKAGFFGDKELRFSEEHMAEVYRKQCEVWPKLKRLCGVSPWLLYDFRAARRQNRFQNGYNRKGLIAEDKLTKKKAFSILQSFYSSIETYQEIDSEQPEESCEE